MTNESSRFNEQEPGGLPGRANSDQPVPALAQTEADSMAPAGAAPAHGLAAHSGKLAIGVAATLGMMIYYNWRERRLAKQDPEGHARLQRLKAGVRNQQGYCCPGGQ
ncbi:MAG: hypothetical protein ACRYGK_18415 [Janthinobacterium lividum]